MPRSKVATLDQALAKCHDGMTVMLGGFTNVGSPNKFCRALADTGIKDLHIIANDAGNDKADGIGTFIVEGRASSLVASHVGLNPKVAEQMNAGTLAVTLVPQGTLAECVRAGGAGLGGVLTPVGIDTLVEESPFCLGRKTVEGNDYLLMKPIHADFALLGTYKCDEFGNCWYKGTMRNFNVVMATAADTVIAETEYLVPVGEIEPENIHTYGMCVDYIVEGERT